MRLAVIAFTASCLCILSALPLLGATTVVHIFDFDFSENPKGQPIVDPVIHPGDTIEWTWDAGNIAHHSTTSVAGIAESWNSGLQLPRSRLRIRSPM